MRAEASMVKLYFLTSSRIKLLHAKYLSREYDVDILPKIYYGVAYSEPRIYDRSELLEKSIEDAKKRWIKSASSPRDKFFFIEDTSVIIHALSKDRDFPGADIKYWMKDNDFNSVDKMLKENNNDRSVTVRSDIILYLPKSIQELEGTEYKSFTSSRSGRITEHEYNFKTNMLYPWLDNKTFNKWFIPNGCNLPISMLPIEKANIYDFRVGAFKQMLEFLEKNHIILKKASVTIHAQQKSFSISQTPVFLVCGLPCAGKTTIGKYLAEKCNYYHIEASDFMYLSFYQHHGVDSVVHVADFAEEALKETPNIVVAQIIEYLREIGDIPVIITGFRSPKEIEFFTQRYDGPYRVEAVYIEADYDKRYDRCLKRCRDEKSLSKKEFLHRDRQQLDMGLKIIKRQLRAKSISNNQDMNTYVRAFLSKYKLMTIDKDVLIKELKNRPAKLEDAILITLSNDKNIIDKYLTTTEIAHLINNFFVKSSFQTSKNNVSRYFNQYFYPFYEIKVENGKNKYRLSQTGLSKALLLL